MLHYTILSIALLYVVIMPVLMILAHSVRKHEERMLQHETDRISSR